MARSASDLDTALVFDTYDLAEQQAQTWPKNLGHNSDLDQSALAEMMREAVEASYLSNTGEELAEDTVVVSGHRHDTELSLDDWRQVGSWAPTAGKLDPAGFRTFATSATRFLVQELIILAGAEYVWPWAKVTLTVSCDLYNAATLALFRSIPSISLQGPGGRSYTEEWVPGRPVYLGDAPVNDDMRRLIAVWSAVVSSAVTVTLWATRLLLRG
jgi:hypothetical protein